MVNCVGSASQTYLCLSFSETTFLKQDNVLSDYQIHEFPNGLRMVHKEVPSTKIAHCGFILDVGSRDELSHQQGIAHFWEHMAFKGTEKRNSFYIINRLEILGGELNAYTTKEKIVFHASLLATHFTKAVELLADITFFSTFPPKEIEKEKGVILEEMSMYLDAPDDAIQDEFDALLYPNHPLGTNILGTQESVRSFKQTDFQTFWAGNVDSDRLIFSSVGPFDLKTAIKKAGPYLSNLPRLKSNRVRKTVETAEPSQQQFYKPITQSHCMIGSRAYPLLHPNRLGFFLLNNLLGGPALNSRLNLSLREKHGLVYSIETSYSPYLDTGAFSIYFGTEPKNLEKAEALVMKELHKLKNETLSSVQLHNAKEQLKGQLAMAEESNMSLMLMLGKSILDMGKVESIASIFNEIDALTMAHLRDIANESWGKDDWTRLCYLPENGKKK